MAGLPAVVNNGNEVVLLDGDVSMYFRTQLWVTKVYFQFYVCEILNLFKCLGTTDAKIAPKKANTSNGGE